MTCQKHVFVITVVALRLTGKMLNTGIVLDLIRYALIKGDRALQEGAWNPGPEESGGPKSAHVDHC